MKEKKLYENAECEIILFSVKDIVTTSGDDLTHVDPDDSSWD